MSILGVNIVWSGLMISVALLALLQKLLRSMHERDLMQFKVVTKPTKPYEGQKTGTSGLRKKTNIFMQENYLANWIQALFSALGDEAKGTSMGLGGDGRYFNKEAVQIILKLAAGAAP
jgi:phosphoglucomutase